MAEVLVLGSGLIGLSAAMLLARDGHEVTVLERDPAGPVGDADQVWSDWERRGVNQWYQPHFFQARMRHELDRELPEVVDEARRLGALFYNPIEHYAPSLGAEPEPGDERFVTLTARRSTMEAAFANAAASMDGVEVRRGVAVAELLAGPEAVAGTPHVVGVCTESGEELRADLVVDATGRRSPLPRWLEGIGAAPVVEDAADSGFAYYGRWFRSGDGSIPDPQAALLSDYGSYQVLTLPADNGTWAVGIVALSSDTPLRRLTDLDTWTRVIGATEPVAHWIDAEPITDGVLSMHKIEDRVRHVVVDGAPLATGVLAVGDSWACTNPSIGRGATIGLLHAIALRDTLRSCSLDDPAALACAFAALSNESVLPWIEATLALDQTRKESIGCELRGERWEPSDPAVEIGTAMGYAASKDAFVLRNFAGIAHMLDTADEVMARPGVFERIIDVGADWREAPRRGPTRDELLTLVDT